MFRVIFIVFVSTFTGAVAQAADQGGMTDAVVGSTFKTMAKAYVVTADLEKIKAQSVKRLGSMSDELFQFKYTRFYRVLGDLPEAVRLQFGLTSGMSRQRAISVVRGMDKKKLAQIIDAIPNATVAREFWGRPGEEDVSLSERMARFWHRVALKFDRPASVHPVAAPH